MRPAAWENVRHPNQRRSPRHRAGQWSFWTNARNKEFDSLTPALQARLISIGDLIERVGLPQVGSPHVRRVQGKIWEMRAQDAQGWGRCLYCAVTGKKVTILLAFAKKTNKTPARYIQLAIERMKDL